MPMACRSGESLKERKTPNGVDRRVILGHQGKILWRQGRHSERGGTGQCFRAAGGLLANLHVQRERFLRTASFVSQVARSRILPQSWQE